MKVLRTNLRQALCAAGFPLAVLGTVLALFSACLETLISLLRTGLAPRENGLFLSVLRQALSSDAMQLALPIMAALPFTASYYDDLHSGFLKACLPRTGCPNYIAGKLAACFISGGMVPVTGILCFGILAGLILLPGVTDPAVSLGEIRWILKSCVLLFFAGAFWSLVGMTAAALTDSRHMACAAPFIFFYVLVILSERYFKGIAFLNPKAWMDPAAGIRGIGLLLILSVSVSLAFTHSAGRRLRNL